MSDASIQEARDRAGWQPPKETRVIPVPQGGCPACGHLMYTVTGSLSLFCPCEDCHSGGLVLRADGSMRRAA